MTTPLPKLLWLTQGNSNKLPSQRLRVIELMPYLSNHFEQSRCAAPTTIMQVWRMRQQLRAANIVVLQKELVARSVLKLIRHFTQRLAYDFDDAVHVRLLADGSCRASRKRSSRFRTICRAVDLVIAGNAILAAEAERAGARRVVILPTGVVLPRPQAATPTTHAPVRLGWIGTDVNLPYIEALEPIFLQLQGEGLVFILRVMAGRAPRFRQFAAVEFVPWTTDSEETFLASLDIGLMPLADNAHTRGKCAYKALQYMSMGKPVVVSDVGVNAEWTAGAGFAATTETELTDALRRLVTEPELRKQMGRIGRDRVGLEFSRPVVANQLRDTLLALF